MQRENIRLKTLRLKYKLTQEELAELAGVNRSTLAHAEKGRTPTLYAGLAIAQALGTTVEYLFLPCIVLDKHNQKGGAGIE